MERTDELILGGWKILQDENGFCFGTDAVLLYHIIPHDCGKTIDLCSGNGAVALMLLAGGKTERVTALELQEVGCTLARKSARLNGAEDRLEVHQSDVRTVKERFSPATFDTVCVNPPYFKRGSGLLPPQQALALCRHEVTCTVDDVLAGAAYLLTEGGRFYMVHRTDRRDEIWKKIQKYDLHITKEYRIFSRPERPSRLFLLEAQKGGEATIYKQIDFTVGTADGSLSEAYKKIYEV